MNEKIENLSKKIGSNKFPTESWLNRGLNPSEDSVIEEMNADTKRHQIDDFFPGTSSTKRILNIYIHT